MKNKKLIIIISITIIIAIAFSGIMIKMIMENGKCIDDPFKYASIKLKESGGEYNCVCYSLVPTLLDFSFSENGIKIKQTYRETQNINFSNIEFIGNERR